MAKRSWQTLKEYAKIQLLNCGCRITAITLAFQARDEGSTPFTRSRILVARCTNCVAAVFFVARQNAFTTLCTGATEPLLKKRR